MNTDHIATLITKVSENSWPVTKINRELQDKKILMPLTHVQKLAGNRFSRICRAFNYWLNAPEEKLRCVEYIIETRVNALVLFDDIEDGASTRYGSPVAHSLYSLALTINAASHADAIVLQKVLELGHPQAVELYSEAFIEGFRGQGIEIYWRDYSQRPSEEEYINMINQKTAAFVMLAFQLLQLFSDNKVDGVKFTSMLGVYYQVRDDYCNLFNQKALESLGETTTKKGKVINTYGSDITEGKFTLPIIHALMHPDCPNEMFHILKQRTEDPILKKHFVSILNELGSAQYTREVLEVLETNIYNEMNRLGENPVMARIMADLNDWK